MSAYAAKTEDDNTMYIVIVVVLIFVLFYLHMYNKNSNCQDNHDHYDYLSNPINVYFFHRPGCPHCEHMMPAWSVVQNYFSSNKKYNLVPVDTSINSMENAQLIEKYPFSGVPTLVLDNGAPFTYSGDRSAEDIISWINRY